MKTFDLGAVTAYALAVKNGFVGTEQEWLEHLQYSAVRYAKQELSEAKQMQARANLDLYGKRSELVEVFPETEFTLEADGDVYGTFLESAIVLEEGKTYTVTWNGTEYVCTAVKQEQEEGVIFICIGDVSIYGFSEESTGEPFLLSYIVQEGVSYGALVTSEEITTATLKVVCDGTTIHTIEPMYLPNGVPYVIEGSGEVILGETTLICTDMENNPGMFDTLATPVIFEAGATYLINYNGTEYTCVCQTMTEEDVTYFVLGDGSIMGLSSNGEPFAVASINVGSWITMVLDTTRSLETATISIVADSTTIQKLDNRCLDLEWYAALAEVEIAPETSVTFTESNMSTVGGSSIYSAIISQEIDMSTISLGDSIRVNIDGNITDLAYAGTGSEIGFGSNSHFFTIGGIEVTSAFGSSFPIVYYYETDKAFCVMLLLSAETQMTVKIARLEPNCLPEKYFPEEIGSFVMRSSTEGSTKKFRVTIDDAGAFAATEIT